MNLPVGASELERVGLQSAEVSLAPPPPKRHFDHTPLQPGHPPDLGWPPHILVTS